MRGRNYKRRKTGQHGRRLLLASLLVASGQFAGAETPVAMVPLPLTPLESESAGVRSNPFCHPVVVEAPQTRASFAPEPVRVSRPQAVAGWGGEESKWRQIESTSDGSVVLASGGELQRREPPAVGGDGLRSFLPSPPTDAAGGMRANPLATEFRAELSPEPKVDGGGLRVRDNGAEDETGFSFSFSDDDANVDAASIQPAGEAVELSLSDDSVVSVDEAFLTLAGDNSAVAASRSTTRPATPWVGTGVQRAPAGLPEPISLRALEPKKFAAGRILQVPPVESTKAGSDDSVWELKPLEFATFSPDDARLVKGGRPRVEVGRPSVAVERRATTSIVPGNPRILAVDTGNALAGDANRDSHDRVVRAVSSVVEKGRSASDQQSPIVGLGTGVASLRPVEAKSDSVGETPEKILASFNLKPTEVRAIKIDTPVTHVQSDNIAVCAAIKAPSGQIQLIATGVGTTRLSVHTLGGDGIEKMVRYEVEVGEVRTSTADSPEAVAMTLTQTVQSAFPGSNVLVDAEAGRLIVTGSCPDEDSARRMLRMIRSACAIPVVDKVKVR